MSPKTAAEPKRTVADMPVSKLEWVPRDSLRANGYNPNQVFDREMKLLKLSILEDGWTQPIVARRDGEIVDGYHRWTVAADPAVAELTDGLVPVAYIDEIDPAQQRMATIRHNRARGSHYVLSMAEIVAELCDLGVSDKEVARRLGMEGEEVKRLKERGNMLARGAAEDFGKGWRPK